MRTDTKVDFVIVERRTPVLMVEAKVAAAPVSSSLRYLKERCPRCDAVQVHLRGARDSISAQKIRLWPAERFLATLVYIAPPFPWLAATPRAAHSRAQCPRIETTRRIP
jgi:hypothetical protein